MKHWFIVSLLLVIIYGCLMSHRRSEPYRLFDVAHNKEITLSQTIQTLRKKRIIIVGEHHDQENHHIAQLRIIQTLYDSGASLAIGLEMFSAKSQDALDRWVSGEMDEGDFQRVYYDNWNLPWPLYSMIFTYARNMRLPLVGLNVPRSITRTVATKGFQSLSPEEKGELHNVTCRVDNDYMEFIRKAYRTKAHGHLNFSYFCEAQLVWDTVMAINALTYLSTHPETSMILLTGIGHAWKRGIPEQITRRSKHSYTVILPYISGSVEPSSISSKNVDYIILNP